MFGAVIQLTVEGRKAMTFSLQHNCPHEDENWVSDFTSIEVEKLNAHWSSAEHEGSVTAEMNVLICFSLLLSFYFRFLQSQTPGLRLAKNERLWNMPHHEWLSLSQWGFLMDKSAQKSSHVDMLGSLECKSLTCFN